MKTRKPRTVARATEQSRSGKSHSKIEPAPAPARKPRRFLNYLTPAQTYYGALLLIAALSLWLRSGMPVHIISNNVFDDALFI